MLKDDLLALLPRLAGLEEAALVAGLRGLAERPAEAVLERKFCIDLLAEQLQGGTDLRYLLLLAAVMRRHAVAGWDPLDHFLTLSRDWARQQKDLAGFFEMQLVLANKRRSKGFFLQELMQEKTYRHEMENSQLLRTRIGTWQRPDMPAPDQPLTSVVFCASFLPESYNIKHADLVINNMIYLARHNPNLRCTLLLTHETIFTDPVFAHYAADSDNVATLKAKVEAANSRYGLALQMQVVAPDLPPWERLQEALARIKQLSPDAAFYVGGYCKCESFYVAHYFRDSIPSVFLATSASNTMGGQYSIAFTRDAHSLPRGAEGRNIVLPSAAFDTVEVDQDAQGDEFFAAIAGKTFLLSALSNSRLLEAFRKNDQGFFVAMEAFFQRNPQVVWGLIGASTPDKLATYNPAIRRMVKRGNLRVKGLVKNFGHYLGQAKLFVSLPNSIGGGFSGLAATSLGIPSVYCRASDLPGLFHLPELGFEDSDYDGFFAAIDTLLNSPEAYTKAQQHLGEIQGRYSMKNVGKARYQAVQTLVCTFRQRVSHPPETADTKS